MNTLTTFAPVLASASDSSFIPISTPAFTRPPPPIRSSLDVFHTASGEIYGAPSTAPTMSPVPTPLPSSSPTPAPSPLPTPLPSYDCDESDGKYLYKLRMIDAGGDGWGDVTYTITTDGVTRSTGTLSDGSLGIRYVKGGLSPRAQLTARGQQHGRFCLPK